ncbi:unnamed protein product, partial [Mesorhabditis spiculigera]
MLDLKELRVNANPSHECTSWGAGKGGSSPPFASRKSRQQAKYQKKLARDLRLDFLEANGGELPPFPAPHEVEHAVEWDFTSDPSQTRPPFGDEKGEGEGEKKEERQEPFVHTPAAPVATGPADFPEPPPAAVLPPDAREVDGQAAAAPGHATTRLVAAGPVFWNIKQNFLTVKIRIYISLFE